MPYLNSGDIRIFAFERFSDHSIKHGIFTRHGGVSTGELSSLNVGNTVGDLPERVLENRRRSFSSVNCDPERSFEVWQVHSAKVQLARGPRRRDEAYQPADAIITSEPGVGLFMRFADCVPILLSDPIAGVVGIVHAGWMGTVKGTVPAAIHKMRNAFSCKPKNILAGIGPSIGPDHYEIGPDVVRQVEKAFGAEAQELIKSRQGKYFLDLWAANKLHLHKAGIEEVEVAGICTGCHLENWYSHRVEQGQTGRFGALISLV
jgi:YfiH family protein